MKILIDTDVLIDFLYQREEFFENAMKIVSLIESKKVNGFISSLIIWNLYYILSKHLGSKNARQKIKDFRSIINIIPIDGRIIDSALSSNIKDFEDSIQFFAAKNELIDIIVTRNTKDYPKNIISIMSPKEFLSSLDQIKSSAAPLDN